MGQQDEGEGYVRFFEYPTHLKKERFKVAVDNAHEIKLKFHPQGYAVLIWSQSYVDSTGKNYYGEHSLLYT